MIGIKKPIGKHNFEVRDVSELSQTMREAFAIASSGRKGPVLIDIPKDIQTAICEYNPYEQVAIKTKQPFIHMEELDAAVEAIKQSKRPYIYAGGGVIASGCEELLRMLSERIAAPVGLSMMGLSALAQTYRRNLGMSGMHGKFAASQAQHECDLMIALGVRFW